MRKIVALIDLKCSNRIMKISKLIQSWNREMLHFLRISFLLEGISLSSAHFHGMSQMTLKGLKEHIQVIQSLNLDPAPSEIQLEEVRRSTRTKKAKTFGPDFVTTFMVDSEPQTFKEAMSTPEAPS